MANNCWNTIIFKGEIENLNKIKEKLQSLYEEGLNYSTYKELFGPDYEDYDYTEEFPKWFHPETDEIEDNTLYVSGDSAWTPMIEFTSMICEVYKVKGKIEYEESGMNFAGIEEYNEEGVCTFSREMSCWQYRFEKGDFYDEFDFTAEYIDDLDEFLEENKLTDKVDMEKVLEIWNQYHNNEEEDEEESEDEE